jgi:hypothetical protein
MAFSPMLAVTLDHANNQILCSATAQVPVLFNAVGVAPQVNLSSNTIAAIRFR